MNDQKYSSYTRLVLRRWRWRRPARGFRLSTTRISVRRLRSKLWTLLGLLGRCMRNMRLLMRGRVAAAGSTSPAAAATSSRRFLVGQGNSGQAAAGDGSNCKQPQRPPCMRSNSFYARAVAECLEFIKGSNASPASLSPLVAHATPCRSSRC